jgi:hypothetical protein
MTYYNWEEIMLLKDTSELVKIIRDRVLSDTAIDYAKKELSSRNNPIFTDSRFIRLKNDLQKKRRNWKIRDTLTYSGVCNSCNKESHYLHLIEKPSGLNIGGKTVMYTDTQFSILSSSFGIFFPFKNVFSKGKEGLLSICIECGQLFIKCPKCKSFQTFNGNKQLCNECGQKILKPSMSD